MSPSFSRLFFNFAYSSYYFFDSFCNSLKGYFTGTGDLTAALLLAHCFEEETSIESADVAEAQEVLLHALAADSAADSETLFDSSATRGMRTVSTKLGKALRKVLASVNVSDDK